MAQAKQYDMIYDMTILGKWAWSTKKLLLGKSQNVFLPNPQGTKNKRFALEIKPIHKQPFKNKQKKNFFFH